MDFVVVFDRPLRAVGDGLRLALNVRRNGTAYAALDPLCLARTEGFALLEEALCFTYQVTR